MKVKTVKAGHNYTVTTEDGSWYRLMLDSERRYVLFYTKSAMIGGYDIARFGGDLSTSTIRVFFNSFS
jgi:hypothetical protein